jgi:hypothetical protein
MEAITEERKDRITRIREVHPYLHPGWVRAMLCYQSKQAFQDPTIHGDMDNLQLRLECFVDVMRRSSEQEAMNELSKVQEFFVDLDPNEFINEEEAAAYAEYLNDR